MLVATAGHVDHGKTSLVQRLTGVDTDRLSEEKRRGLTIELGYAFLDTPSGEPIGFIDVPGHNRFINTMIAGVSGIDAGMLVVAANDGIMPQTLEHLEVMRLLSVDRFIAVISKIDLVNHTRIDLVERQIADLIPDAPLYRISSKTGEGVEQLHDMLAAKSSAAVRSQCNAPFRMYVDRAFTRKGVGLVVTGTCLSGKVTSGDILSLHVPGSSNADLLRVREVHAQGRAVESGHAGQRCALNLSGKFSRESVRRGSSLCADADVEPSLRLDTRCRISSESGIGKPLKHLGRAKLYLGSCRLGAATYLLEREEMDQRIQLIMDEKIIAFRGDRFILRSDNERITLAGGIVIDPVAPQKGKTRSNRIARLAALEQNQPAVSLAQLLDQPGEVVSARWFRRIWNLTPEQLATLLAESRFDHVVRVPQGNDQLVLSRELWNDCSQAMLQMLAEWHSTHPMSPGIYASALQSMTKNLIPESLFKALLDEHTQAGRIVYRGQLLHALGHKPTLSHQVQREWQGLETFLQSQGIQLPLRSEIMRALDFSADHLERLVRPVIKRGELYEIGKKRLALPATILQLAQLVGRHLETNSGISVVEAKQLFGFGRGLTIEVLEFFDQIGYTRRVGNAREIADSLATDQLLS